MTNQEKGKRTERTSLNNPGSNKPMQGTVANCERLNVRSEPSMNGKIITTLLKGAPITIIDRGFGAWTKIDINSEAEAYVMSRYIEITSSGD